MMLLLLVSVLHPLGCHALPFASRNRGLQQRWMQQDNTPRVNNSTKLDMNKIHEEDTKGDRNGRDDVDTNVSSSSSHFFNFGQSQRQMDRKRQQQQQQQQQQQERERRQQKQEQHRRRSDDSSFLPNALFASMRSFRLPSTALFSSRQPAINDETDEANDDNAPHVGQNVVATARTAATATTPTTAPGVSLERLRESVHLKLYETPASTITTTVTEEITQRETETDQVDESDNESESVSEPKPEKRQRAYTVLGYRHTDGTNYAGLNISKRHFQAWLRYALKGENIDPSGIEAVRQTEVSNRERKRLRERWEEGRLLCDRTELLTVYDSDRRQKDGTRQNNTGARNNKNRRNLDNSNHVGNTKNKRKRGGFSDLLHLYASRHLNILQDERDSDIDLVEWLEGSYGRKETEKLRILPGGSEGEMEQLQVRTQSSRVLIGDLFAVCTNTTEPCSLRPFSFVSLYHVSVHRH